MAASAFPDFYIVGAAKAGTTSLVEMLREHEQVWFPHEKEPHHFFLRKDDRAWTIRDGAKVLPLADALPYASEEAYLALYSDAPSGVLSGDASTQYLVNNTAAGAIHAQKPDAKIVAVLRNPTARAYSAFVHARSRGEEACGDFSYALDECFAGERATAFATNYVAEGDYARHLKVWKGMFGDRLHVILFDDLLSEPQAVFDRLTRFLGIAQRALPAASASHKNASIEITNPIAYAFRMAAKRLRRLAPGLFELPLFRRPYEALLARMGRKPDALSADQKARLDAYYEPQLAILESMIGRDLSKWRA